MQVRRIELNDARRICSLLAQLGYPTDEQAVRHRLARLLSDDRVGCWVGENDGKLVGLITGHLSWHIEVDDAVARLTALVVDEDERGRGTGRRLAEVFEEWARYNGAKRLSLNSSSERDGAHAAYASMGWSVTGLRFAKRLS
jgi:GNAT superfamily N-acetyltransferase